MAPVFVVLAGTGLRTDEKLFMGWFGPRGLASIVFAVIVLNDLPDGETITMTVISRYHKTGTSWGRYWLSPIFFQYQSQYLSTLPIVQLNLDYCLVNR